MEVSFRAILFIIGFIVACYFVIFSTMIQLKKSKRILPLDFSTVPICVVLILFLCTSIPWVVIVRGILGAQTPDWAKDPTSTSYLVPYTVIILFMSLAYVCMSAEHTKVFVVIANKFSKLAMASKNPGIVGLSLFSILAAIFTLVTSNDIVILTLTPIILQFSRNTDSRLLLSLLLAEFCSANSFSAGLLSGNPSNIILSSVFNINFTTYLQYLLIPALISGCSVYVYCLILALKSTKTPKVRELRIESIEMKSVVNNEIKPSINTADIKPSMNNVDIKPSMNNADIKPTNGNEVKPVESNEQIEKVKGSVSTITISEIQTESTVEMASPIENSELNFDLNMKISLCLMLLLFILFLFSTTIQNQWPIIQFWHIAVFMFILTLIKDFIVYRKNLKTIWVIVQSLPWKVPLFLFAMFILVETASYYHFTNVIAEGLANSIIQPVLNMGDIITAIFFNVLTCIACIIFNNLPATIFVTRILSEPAVKNLLGDKLLLVTFSVAAGTNFGACILPHCSLAGLMWSCLVKNKKVLKKVWLHGSLICLILVIVCSLLLVLTTHFI